MELSIEMNVDMSKILEFSTFEVRDELESIVSTRRTCNCFSILLLRDLVEVFFMMLLRDLTPLLLLVSGAACAPSANLAEDDVCDVLFSKRYTGESLTEAENEKIFECDLSNIDLGDVYGALLNGSSEGLLYSLGDEDVFDVNLMAHEAEAEYGN